MRWGEFHRDGGIFTVRELLDRKEVEVVYFRNGWRQRARIPFEALADDPTHGPGRYGQLIEVAMARLVFAMDDRDAWQREQERRMADNIEKPKCDGMAGIRIETKGKYPQVVCAHCDHVLEGVRHVSIEIDPTMMRATLDVAMMPEVHLDVPRENVSLVKHDDGFRIGGGLVEFTPAPFAVASMSMTMPTPAIVSTSPPRDYPWRSEVAPSHPETMRRLESAETLRNLVAKPCGHVIPRNGCEDCA